MRIKVIKYGIIHFYAQCNDCDWDDAIQTNDYNRNQKVRNAVYKHIKKTGHSVIIEAGKSTEYSPIK